MAEVKLIPAGSLAGGELTAVFNAAYSDYSAPVAMDEAAMQRHLADNDIELEVSRVALAPEPVAFALIGRRGREAWLGGMGTVPEWRRRGVGERTLDAAARSSAEDGAEVVRLEVLEENRAAIALYERFGFTRTRRLIVCSLRELDPPRTGWGPIRVDDARSWIAEKRLSQEPWQRGDEVLARLAGNARPLAAITLEREGEIAAALIYTSGASGTSILQMAAGDDELAAEGLRAVGVAAGGPIRLLNFPVGEPVAAAVAGLGVRPDHVQLEMQLRL